MWTISSMTGAVLTGKLSSGFVGVTTGEEAERSHATAERPNTMVNNKRTNIFFVMAVSPLRNLLPIIPFRAVAFGFSDL
jgi:hypothetical protein